MASSSKFSSITTDSGLEIKTVHSNKLDYLYEVSIEPEVVNPTSIPTINPYSAYGKQSFSPTRVIKLIRAHPKGVKEYIQASKVDQHPIPATRKEQFITLHIPNDFPMQWKQQGYTHIHFGAIRISLSFHGRKGLPVVARVALLDTRFKQYQHACIATTETTLNAGTVFVTLFPNFNMSLADPHLLEALKVQVQIIGAEQVSDAIAATLHYQMVYRVQNHALDLAIPGGENALLIRVDEKNGASCTHVPRQISKQDFKISSSFYYVQDIIKYFDKEGLPVSWFQDPISGHIYFDVCNICEECQIENILGLDLPDLSCKKRSKSKQVEPRPCKPDLDPQNPDTDSFVSQRSQFNGYQIPTEWISKNTKTSCPVSKKDFILIIKSVLIFWKKKQESPRKNGS
ncbi:unnamed protein product [Coffea canephora]|uniref:DH200=94 genomic scaffold, scaffold_3002 n=1 Tax=Coffea canephora TaxID=49390 RepID=A0A068VL04_COFCA|nr:unnamed protein product [Coffea canephora]